MALIPRSVAHKRRRTASHTTITEDAVSPVASSITILQSDNKRPKLGISPAVDDQRDLDALVDAVAWCFGDVGCELGNGSNRIRREISECRFVLLHEILALLSSQWTVIPSVPPSQLVKNLRERHGDELEIRIAIKDSSNDGGYEIRRRENKVDVEKWSIANGVLLESIPSSQSSLIGIHHILQVLLQDQSEPSSISYISPYLPQSFLPPTQSPHRLQNACIVYLQNEKTKTTLLDALPWVGSEVEDDQIEDESGNVRRKLRRQGCRALDLMECERKKNEYLEYQNKIDELLNPLPPPSAVRPAPSSRNIFTNGHSATATTTTTTTTPRPAATPRYPKSCLLLAQNLPESTNKTALKALFNEVLEGEDEVDYVDWDKGKVHAFIRVASAAQAMRISDAFPFDATADHNKVRCEIVCGTREEIYWMGLPEKIRVAAVEREAGRRM